MRSRKRDCSDGDTKRMRSEGAGRISRYYARVSSVDIVAWPQPTYMFIHALQLPFRRIERHIHLWRFISIAPRIFDQYPRPRRLRPTSHGHRIALLDRLTVHVPAVSPHRLQLLHVEHLAEHMELVFLLVGRRAALLDVEIVPERIEVGAVLDQARHIDLRADEVAQVAAGVEEWSHHEEVHKGRAVAAAVAVLDAHAMRYGGKRAGETH
jgi:hypothetical protein